MRKQWRRSAAQSRTAGRPLCFRYLDACNYLQFFLFLNRKQQATSHILCLYSPACFRPDRKPQNRFSHDAAHILSSANLCSCIYYLWSPYSFAKIRLFCLFVCVEVPSYIGAEPPLRGYYQYFQALNCLAQGHNMAEIGFEPPNSTLERPRSSVKIWSWKYIYIYSFPVFSSAV